MEMTSATTNTTEAETVRRVFVTSDTYTGQLGGIAGADAKCQASADAAMLAGEFRAWISTDTSSPQANFLQSAGPYVRIDGIQVANSWISLTSGGLDAPLELDEWGQVVPNGDCGNVWTKTRRDGTPFVEYSDCSDFTNTEGSTLVGRTDAINSTWTESCPRNCNELLHLYCVEQ